MTIYRGPGGTGDATSDSDTTEFQQFLIQTVAAKDAAIVAENAAETAASAASGSASNAATSATAATSSASAANTSATNAASFSTAAASSATAAASSASTASTQATNASASATAAANSATAADSSATSASTSASTATTKAAEASTSASNAATSATAATTSASAASTSASNAANSATGASAAQIAAESARDAALSAYDNFDDRYLGPKATDPTLDNDGNTLLTGALYFDTSTSVMKVYTGSAWVAAYVSAAGVLLTANNLSDLSNTVTARTNLNVPTRTGGDASGTWGINVTGNAVTVTNGVYTTGDQTIAGVKTLSSNPILSAGTANGVTYLNGSKVLTSGSVLTFDGSNLGIGTSSPAYKVHAVRSGGGIVGRFDTTSDGITDVYGYGLEITRSVAYIKGSSALHLGSAAGYSAVVLDSSGNLGLGVTPSASTIPTLQFGTNAVVTSGNSTHIGANTYYNGSWSYVASSISASRYQQNGGTHQWFTAPSGTAGNAITFTQAMTLNASGNLLLGTTTVGTSGTGLTMYGASQSEIRLQNSTTGTGTTNGIQIAAAGSDFYLWNFEAGSQIFATSGTERARIDSSGNLLVGTTSTATNSSGTSIAKFTANVATIRNVKTATGNYDSLQNYHNGSYVGGILYSDTVTAFVTSSDYRLKDITGPITTSGVYIDSLNPVEGTWKADGSTFIGLIAHEAQEASRTQVATGEKDGEEMQGMSYSSSEMIANMIAELKALRARVAALEAA